MAVTRSPRCCAASARSKSCFDLGFWAQQSDVSRSSAMAGRIAFSILDAHLQKKRQAEARRHAVPSTAQNTSFRASCKMRGLFAWPEISPKAPPPTVVFGAPNCTWLKVLKDSARNCSLAPSNPNGNSLKIDADMLFVPGARTLGKTRGAVPRAYGSGFVASAAQAPQEKYWSIFQLPALSSGALRSGRWFPKVGTEVPPFKYKIRGRPESQR